MLIPVPFLLFFAAAAAGLLNRAVAGGTTLAFLVVGAAAAMSMLWPLGGAVSSIALLMAQGGGDPVAMASLDAIAPYTLALSAVPRCVMIAALSLAGSALLADHRFFPLLALGTLLFMAWMVVVSISLLRISRSVEHGGIRATDHLGAATA
jgi:hypothetical protein